MATAMLQEEYNPNPSQDQLRKWETQQNELKTKVIFQDDLDFDPVTLEGLKYIAGVDLSFPEDNVEQAVACLVVLEFPSLEVVHRAFLKTRLTLPYIPGFLAFREVEPILDLLTRLKQSEPHLYPQVVLVDGNGLLHPRQCGIACHLGVVADIPTIGSAKNFLAIGKDLVMGQVKQAYKPLLQRRGDRYILKGQESGVVYGAALRTTDAAPNPVFVSQGHRISLETALRIVLAVSRYRIPEPIRRADLDSREYIRNTRSSSSSSSS
ncbi:hypothetical protein VTP01DRAFT_10526 [Rhizomucor pusillus]|uniref:uncharacterized protein n=1 Tax=Rhizomucor pusillus TaxID=4840 RepID=UPI003743A5B4